jgi:hypothetical protein
VKYDWSDISFIELDGPGTETPFGSMTWANAAFGASTETANRAEMAIWSGKRRPLPKTRHEKKGRVTKG